MRFSNVLLALLISFQTLISGQRWIMYRFPLYPGFHPGLRASGVANKLRSFGAFDLSKIIGQSRRRHKLKIF